jgi:hypothetical protein
MFGPTKGIDFTAYFQCSQTRQLIARDIRLHPAPFSPTISIVVLLPSRLRIHASPNSSPPRAFDAPRTIALWHLASLDAPTVALVWSLSFAWVARVRLPMWIPALLMLAVWAVYVADRLLDARAAFANGNVASLRERHLFHWHHRRVFLPLAALAAAAAGFLIIDLMPTAAKERNSLLAAASLVYFTRVHSGRGLHLRLPKELLVGLLFTAGCVIPSWSRNTLSGTALLGALFVPACFYALLAWLNCHAIDRWEADANSRASLRIYSIAVVVAFTGFVAATLLTHAQPRSAALLVAGSAAALLLAVLDRVRRRLSPVALRAASDLALLTPLLLLPVARLIG